MNSLTIYRVYFQPGESFNDFDSTERAQEYVANNPGSTGPVEITVQLDNDSAAALTGEQFPKAPTHSFVELMAE